MDDETILAQASNLIQQQRNALYVDGERKPLPTPAEMQATLKLRRSFADRLAAIPDLPPLTDEEQQRQRELAMEQAAAKGMAEANRREATLLAIVGRRYSSATIEGFRVTNAAQQEVKRAVAAYVERLEENVAAGAGMVLLGPPGTGKDHLVVATLRAAARKGFRVAWIDGTELFASARDNIDATESESKWAKRFTEPDVLAISDPVPPIGEVKEGFQISTLFRIVDRRYRDMKPTFITLNVADAKEASKRMSANIVDRLSHGSLVLKCQWSSYRMGE